MGQQIICGSSYGTGYYRENSPLICGTVKALKKVSTNQERDIQVIKEGGGGGWGVFSSIILAR